MGKSTPVKLVDEANAAISATNPLDTSAVLGAGTALIGKVGIDQATANANEVVIKSGTVTTVTTVGAVTGITNALPAGTNVIGVTQDGGPAAGAGTVAAPVHGDFSTATAVTAAPTGGQKWVVTDIFISTAAAAEIDLREETSGTVVFGPVLMPANGYAQFTPRGKLKLATADKKVMGKSSTADHVTIQVSGVSEA